MTRLTVSLAGDPLTFRPVTSSIIRESKDGMVNVIIMLFGTHYNISVAGILQIDSAGDIDPNTQIVTSENHFLAMACKKITGLTKAELSGTFSSFMYFYPGLKIRAHLKLSQTTHVVPAPMLEAHYHFKDLLSGDQIYFNLARDQANLRFELIEIVDGVQNVIYTQALSPGVDNVYFELAFLENGKSKLYTFANYGLVTQVKTRKWIGDIKAKIGECNVAVMLHNDEDVLHTLNSDMILLNYPQMFIKFDRTLEERLIGRVQMFDDMNESDEAAWVPVKSRDHPFVGNRVIENGMVRVIIKTLDPTIEIWGWNYNSVDAWEKAFTIIPDTDTDVSSLKIQNISFEYFNFTQLKCNVNFGTSIYSFVMSRGDPYITLLNTQKSKFKIRTQKNRFGVDFKDRHNGYTLLNTQESGNPSTKKATGTATLVSVVATNTITINGLVYTAVAGAKANNTQFSIDGSDSVDAADLADSINNDTRIGIDKPSIKVIASVPALSNVVTLTANAGGTSGNSITMSENSTTITLSGAALTGGAATGGPGTETLTNFGIYDNYCGFYTKDYANEVVGWVSFVTWPEEIKLNDLVTELECILTFGINGGVFGAGVLPTFPSNLVNGVPLPFVVAADDQYIKWRANEAILSFRELETIKKR